MTEWGVPVLSWADASIYDGLLYSFVTLSSVLTFKYIRFPDVTVAGSFVLGAAVAAFAQVRMGLDGITAVALAMAAGSLAGLTTSAFALLLRIDGLLSGVLCAFMLYGVNLLMLRPTLPYGNAETLLSSFARTDRTIDLAGLAWHPAEIALVFVVIAATKLLLDAMLASEFGLFLRALEDDAGGASAIRRHGASPNFYKSFALVAGNALVAAGGALVSMREGAATLDRGFDVLITGIVAFIIGQQIREFLPAIGDSFAGSRALRFMAGLGRLRQLKVTTAAILGSTLYFALIAMAYRTGTPPEFVRIAIALYVALTVGDFKSISQRSWLRRMQKQASRAAKGKHFAAAGVLEVCDLAYRYPKAGRDAFTDVAFALGRGELARIVGTNGSGKSTLLRLIAGLIDAPATGRLLIDGQDLTFAPGARLTKTAYLSQDARGGIVQTFTVEENLALANSSVPPSLLRRALSRKTLSRLESLIASSGTDAGLLGKTARDLSGGEAQLLNILDLFIRTRLPDLILLDEPFNNLDAQNVQRVASLISAIHARGAAILIVNHTVPVDFAYAKTISLRPAPPQ
ncbi:MAG TPA: ATP-binding cassette domain-containing protein [Rhizomicrobium sp.]|nr:ATP-binding cassette domain-containing protein [Rhizomicrobium sp.]